MLTLVLTRHGLTGRSIPEQHLGQTIDIGLSDDGRAQAAALAARLAPISFERIVSSPLVRARQTAALIAAVPGSAGSARPAVEIDPRLTEMDYGDWEGLTYEQIEERAAADWERWVSDPATLPYPGGESGNDVAARARAFLVDALADHVARHGTDDTAESADSRGRAQQPESDPALRGDGLSDRRLSPAHRPGPGQPHGVCGSSMASAADGACCSMNDLDTCGGHPRRPGTSGRAGGTRRVARPPVEPTAAARIRRPRSVGSGPQLGPRSVCVSSPGGRAATR